MGKLSPPKVRSLARLYASMTPEQIANHEDWVSRFKAEQAHAEAKIAAAALERAAKLLVMSDLEAVQASLSEGAPSANDYYPEDALGTLTAAGFVRARDVVILTPKELRALLEVSWRDGHSRPEIFDDEWSENMRSDVDRTIAELDKWKALGVPKEAYPDYEDAP